MDHHETLDAPGAARVPARPDDRDASDVIEGDIGEARLREPIADESSGADLDALKRVVDVQDKQTEGSELNDRAKSSPAK